MNAKFLTISAFAICLCVASCAPFENHEHDGLYVTNNKILGFANAMIINGNELKNFSTTGFSKVSCKQFEDRIEIENGNVFYLDDNGDLVIAANSIMKFSMVKVSNKTNYDAKDVMVLLDTAYVKNKKSLFNF
jgi:hypothetical protein